MKELLRKIKKEWGRPFRQRVSWVLICAFLVQTVIPGVATPVLGGEKTPGSYSLEKKSEVGEEGTITYTLTARASASEASPGYATPTSARSYTSVKKASASESSESELPVTGGVFLDDKYIVDYLPSVLGIKGIYLGEDKDTRIELTSGTDYYIKNGCIVIPIGDAEKTAAASSSEVLQRSNVFVYNAEGKIIKAVVTIEASLKDTEVGDHASDINSEQGFTWRLHNLAELRDSEDGDTLAKDTDDNFITMQCWMNKDGREVDATGQSLKWTIQLEANIRSDESYIVDWVRLDTGKAHNDSIEYKMPLEIQIGGETREVSPASSSDADILRLDGGTQKPAAYFNSPDGKSKVSELMKPATSCSDLRMMIYTYQKDNETETYIGFILPAQELLRRPVTITYETIIHVDEAHETVAPTSRVDNSATFFYRYKPIGGTGPDDWVDNVIFDKTVEYNHAVLKKSLASYVPTTQTAVWKFEINRTGTSLGELNIVDYFYPDKQILQTERKSFNSNGELELIKYDRGSQDAVANADPLILQLGTGKNNYSYNANSGDFEIHMEDIKEDDYYIFYLTTRIVDPALFYEEGGNSFENKADYTFRSGDDPTKSGETSATLKNTTELLTKEAVGSYHYDTNLTEWKVGFNNNRNYNLQAAYVVDTLPEGLVFNPASPYNCSITSVTRTKRAGENSGSDPSPDKLEKIDDPAGTVDLAASGSDARVEEVARYQINDQLILSVQVETTTSPNGYTQQILYLYPQDLGDDGNYHARTSEDAWTIQFTTYAEDTYRFHEFRSASPIDLTNKAGLKGFILAPGGSQPLDVSNKTAVHHAAKPVNKIGEVSISDKYDGLPWIHWKLLVNQTEANYAGAILEDKVDSSYMELEAENLKYFWVKVTADGKIDEGSKTVVDLEADTSFTIEKAFNSFKITYPKEETENTSKALLVEYDTFITGSVPDKRAENDVSIQLPGTKSDESIGWVDNCYSMDDSAYESLKKLKMLNLLKLSENSKEDKGALSGAKFQIDALYEWNNDSWEPLNKPYLTKTAVTDENGKLRFVRLRNNYLYKLTETEAAPGYNAKSFQPIYFMISDSDQTSGLGSWPEECNGFTCNFHSTKTGGKAAVDYKVLNRPDTELYHLQFAKIDQITKEPIAGVSFKLYDIYDSFKELDILKTDEKGLLTLPILDPNTTYRLEETEPADGYKRINGYLEIQVESRKEDEEIVYSFHVTASGEMESFYTDSVMPLSASENINTYLAGYITNEPLLANVKFPKTDQLGNLLSDPKYNDISFKMTPGRDGAKEENIYLNEGWLKLENLRRGTYTLMENGLPDSLKGEFSEVNPPQKIEITVSPNYESADSTGSKDSANCKVTFKNCTSENPKEQFDVNAVAVTEMVQGNEITYWVPESTEKQPYPLHIINNRQFGYVQIHKVEALINDGKTEITGTPVEGADFTVYEVKGDGSALDADAKEVLTLTTDKEGKFPLNYTNLVCNQEYFLKESSAPEGYQMDPDLKNGVPFTIRNDQETVYIGLNKKAGDTVTRDEKQEVNPEAGNQELLYYNIKRGTGSLRAAKYGAYQGIGGTVSRKALAGAEFGLLKASSSEISYKTVSDENGLIRFDHVTAGTYTLRELSAPSGYAKPADGEGEQVVEIYENMTTGLTLEDQLVFNNEPLAFSLKLHKTDSDGQSLSGAKFLLQAVSADQTVTDLCYLKETENGIHVLPDPLKAEDQPLLTLKNDTIWDYFTVTGEETEGRLDPSKASAALYYGSDSSYQVKEVKAPSGYALDETIYPVDRERARKLDGGAYLISNHKTPDGEAVFANFTGYGDIAGRKVRAPQTEQSSSVAGAVMGLFAGGTETFTVETTYQGMIATSGEDGSFRFEHVPYGTYLVAEITAPSGYYLNTTDSFRVTVSSGESLEGIRGTKDPATGEKAEGAEAEPIVIADEKRSEGGGDGDGGHGDHGGHGGDGGGYKTSGDAGDATGPGKDLKDIQPVPSKPDEPLPSVQEIIEEPETQPVPSEPDEPLPSDQEIIEEPKTLPVPSEPEEALPSDQEIIEEPETQEGDYVITTLDGKEVYRGKDRPSREFRCSLPAGEYLEFMDIGEEPIPLARFRVDEGGVLTELSLTGDTGRSMLLLWLLLGGGAAFALLLLRRRRRV